MTTENTPTADTIKKLLDQIMNQAQVFASCWSLAGGRFDPGDGFENAEIEKQELYNMIISAMKIAIDEQHTINTKRIIELESEIKQSDEFIKSIADLAEKHEQRFEFLHATNIDDEGYEWGIYKIKQENGKAIDIQNTLSCLSDLDTAIEKQAHKTKP